MQSALPYRHVVGVLTAVSLVNGCIDRTTIKDNATFTTCTIDMYLHVVDSYIFSETDLILTSAFCQRNSLYDVSLEDQVWSSFGVVDHDDDPGHSSADGKCFSLAVVENVPTHASWESVWSVLFLHKGFELGRPWV